MANLVIKVDTAAEQLGLSVEDFRKLLEVFYPKSWQTIKQISKKNFKLISEQLMEKAIDQNPDVDMEELEQSIETKTNDYNTDFDSDFTGDGSDDFDNSQDEEETALTAIPEQEIAVRVRQILDTNSNLKQQTLDLSRITRTVALLASDKAVEDFQAIYAARFNQGMSAFIDDFSQTALTTITEIQSQKVTDFFEELDLNYNTANHQATDQLKELMALYQSPTQ